MRTATLFVLMLAGTASGAEQGTAPAEIIQQLRARWIASSEYTLAVAEKMPADKYAFRPTAEQMTFGQQLVHIAEQNQLIFGEMLSVAAPEKRAVALSKAEALAKLKETTTLGLEVLQERASALPTDVAEVLNGMMLALDHTTHHRGQAIVYLRLNGITPPEYRR
jgi:uncharacterized damage-inducible protein DinB